MPELKSTQSVPKRWTYKPKPLAEQVTCLIQSIHVNPYLSHVLVQRGINDYERARHFFRPALEDLHDPFLMRDMDRAVTRLKQAFDGGEKVLIYGDYDVDGTTAVALVYRYFKRFYPHCDFYIPDRLKEGYGISEYSIHWAAEHGFSLIVALDLGIKSIDMVAFGKQKGIDFIICDHHAPDSRLPEAVAVLNPKISTCSYPFKELSGCGLGFKLVQAFASKYGMEQNSFSDLDLVAVSIAADIVPINGENRILAFHGLKKLNTNPVLGLASLKQHAAVKDTVDISDVVFKLAPRINAAGRVSHARAAVHLLIAGQRAEADAKARQLGVNNTLRKEWDQQATAEALSILHADPNNAFAKSTVLYKKDWNKGIIGIVAARCIETYYRPTIIFTRVDDKLVGSGRSIKGFDLYQAVLQCVSLLENFGGHKYAVGMTLKETNLAAFRDRFDAAVSATLEETMLIPTIDIDTELPLDAITAKFVSILTQMEPFGPEHPRPVFVAKNLFLASSVACFKDIHIRFSVGQQCSSTKKIAMGFNMGAYRQQLLSGKPFDMAFTIQENKFQGQIALELRIKDIKFGT